MNVLLDTHAVIWWFNEPEKLSKRANSTITNQANTVSVSAASAWEMAIKASLGKLQTVSFVLDLSNLLQQENFFEQPVTVDHAVRGGLLPLHHRDPFDRLLVAQAQSLNIPIISADTILDAYDIKRIW
jgi:PIN domain nuclease of toxin-antitoxin system